MQYVFCILKILLFSYQTKSKADKLSFTEDLILHDGPQFVNQLIFSHQCFARKSTERSFDELHGSKNLNTDL